MSGDGKKKFKVRFVGTLEGYVTLDAPDKIHARRYVEMLARKQDNFLRGLAKHAVGAFRVLSTEEVIDDQA